MGMPHQDHWRRDVCRGKQSVKFCGNMIGVARIWTRGTRSQARAIVGTDLGLQG